MELKTININKSYKGIEVVKGVSVSLKKGEIVGLLGPNGAGKSTLANIIAGKEEYEVTTGTIELNGEDISELAPEERAHNGVFLSFQYPY